MIRTETLRQLMCPVPWYPNRSPIKWALNKRSPSPHFFCFARGRAFSLHSEWSSLFQTMRQTTREYRWLWPYNCRCNLHRSTIRWSSRLGAVYHSHVLRPSACHTQHPEPGMMVAWVVVRVGERGSLVLSGRSLVCYHYTGVCMLDTSVSCLSCM